MVTITNGAITTSVPIGAYNSVFKHQGYRMVDGLPSEGESREAERDAGYPDENEEFLSRMKEKPLSQWTKDEVRKYAAINGIDISGTKNPTEAKHIIKGYMAEHSEG